MSDSSKKKVRQEVEEKLTGALAVYQQELGEKKLAGYVKKASKLISRDLLKISKKQEGNQKKEAERQQKKEAERQQKKEDRQKKQDAHQKKMETRQKKQEAKLHKKEEGGKKKKDKTPKTENA